MKRLIADRNAKLEEAHVRSDNQIMQIRVILDKSEREHQREMDSEVTKRDEFAGKSYSLFRVGNVVANGIFSIDKSTA